MYHVYCSPLVKFCQRRIEINCFSQSHQHHLLLWSYYLFHPLHHPPTPKQELLFIIKTILIMKDQSSYHFKIIRKYVEKQKDIYRKENLNRATVHIPTKYVYEDPSGRKTNTGRWLSNLIYNAKMQKLSSQSNKVIDELAKLGVDNVMEVIKLRDHSNGNLIRNRGYVRPKEGDEDYCGKQIQKLSKGQTLDELVWDLMDSISQWQESNDGQLISSHAIMKDLDVAQS